MHSIPGLTGIAGALASDEHNLVFTSNRGENTIGIFTPEDEEGLIDIFDTSTMQRVETIPTEKGAHTIGFDPDGSQIFALLPFLHRMQVYEDEL